ncbi:MAG: restriction endonuclease subunit S [Ardenticatenaceae bacterium]|nr:restriction endonuclease subunit S [Ardenticatenaceae bacterium]
MTTNGCEERPLPDGWMWTKLSDACYIELGQSPPSSTYNTEGVGLPFFQGKAEFGDLYPTPVKWCSEPKKIAETGDVLISVRAPVGSTNLNREKSCIGRGLAAIRPNDSMSNLYFLYLLRYIQQELVDQATGTTFQAISGKVLREQKIPLAPSPEQHRIIAEIEKQFTRLDQAVASLRRLQGKLAQYRASVLKAACDGRLVPQDPNDEPATTLLTRILAERRAQWQAANPGKKYKEVAGVETADLPDLPEGWVWATLDQCFDVSRGRFSIRPRNDPRYYNGSHPFVQIGDLPRDGGNITQASKTLNDKGLEVSRKFPKGTVLIAIVGATIGNTGVLTFDSCSPDSLVAFQAENQVRLQFLEMYLRSKKLEIRSNSYASGGQPNINLAYLLPYPIAVPPLAEQERIVAEVERRLSVVTATEQAITANLARAERLRQAILHRAFTGQLVPQEEVSAHAS